MFVITNHAVSFTFITCSREGFGLCVYLNSAKGTKFPSNLGLIKIGKG